MKRALPIHRWLAVAAFAMALSVSMTSVLSAQEAGPAVQKKLGPADIILPHITDSKHLEVPCVRGWQQWACEVDLPAWPVTIGGRTIDFGPTKHVVFLLLAAVLVAVTLILTARSHVRRTHE